MSDSSPAEAHENAEAGPGPSTLSLANHFLIAMPSMADSRFSDTVVYMLEHNAPSARWAS